MKKNLAKIALGIVLAGSLCGCAELGGVMSASNDPRARALGTALYIGGEHDNRMQEAREGRSGYDPWQGTPIVSKQVDPDGTITFLVDADKTRKAVKYDYLDSFVNATKYDRKIIPLTSHSGLVVYTPKN